MKTLKALLQKHKDIVLYVVFGGLTTLVNIVSFYVLEQLLAVATGCPPPAWPGRSRCSLPM